MENDLNKQWAQYIKEEHYANPRGFMEDMGFDEVASEITGESRWGIFYENVYKAPDGSLVGLSYEDAAAEGEYDADMMGAEFYPVEAQEVTVTKYVRI
jgi:hypothetical protein